MIGAAVGAGVDSGVGAGVTAGVGEAVTLGFTAAGAELAAPAVAAANGLTDGAGLPVVDGAAGEPIALPIEPRAISATTDPTRTRRFVHRKPPASAGPAATAGATSVTGA